MGSPVPFEHWPSRTAAIHDLMAQGLSKAAIAARIGISAKNVDSLSNVPPRMKASGA